MAILHDGRSATDAPRQSPPAAGALGPAPAWPQDALDALPLNRRHALVFGLCAAGLLFESLNLQLMSYAAPLIATAWSLGPKLVGVAISAAIGGMLVGAYLFGPLADRIGRRPTFQVTVAIFSLLTVLSGLSANLAQLAAARFLAGLGIGGSIPVETAVLAEFTPARWRPKAIAVWAMALPLGALIAPLLVGALPESLGWRGLLFLGGAPALLVLVLRRAIPETPQHLAARGRRDAAAAALAWVQGRPATAPPLVRAEPQARPERSLFSRDLRAATALSWALYFGAFFAYYGFALWLPTLLAGSGAAKPAILRFMLIAALSGLAGRVALLGAAHRLSRAAAMAGCSLAGAAALAAFALRGGQVSDWGLAGLAGFFLEGTFSVLIPYVAALYPAATRATGVGWAGGMGRIGTALAPLTMGLVAGYDPRLPFLVLSVVAAATSVVAALSSRRGD